MKLNKFIVSLIFCSWISCDFPEHYFSPEPDCSGKQKGLNPLEFLSNKSPKDFRYFFKSFQDIDAESANMLTNFRNDSICFDAKILVQKWDKLAGMRRTNGKSYPKELYDLNWKIKEGKIIYLDMHKIID